MKTITKALLTLTAVGLSVATTQAQAQYEQIDKTISLVTTRLDVKLNEQSVKCTALGYSMPNLKVIIPALARITVNDHRNPGEDGPCVTAGSCIPHGDEDVFEIGDIIKPGEELTVKAPVSVEVIRRHNIDHTNKRCIVSLVEKVNTVIKNIAFRHQAQADLGSRVYEDCL